MSHFKVCNGTDGQAGALLHPNRVCDKGVVKVQYVQSDVDGGEWNKFIIENWTKMLSVIKASSSLYKNMLEKRRTRKFVSAIVKPGIGQ